MSRQSENIIKDLKARILESEFKSSSVDVGRVHSIGDGIAFVKGLDDVLSNELVHFKDDIYGLALNLEDSQVGIALLGDDQEIRQGDEVTRTQKVVEVPVGDALLGRVVDALGRPLDGQGEIKTSESRPIERIAPGVMTRERSEERSCRERV